MKIFKNSIVLAIVACLLWSTAFVGVKIALKYSAPLQFAGIRYILAGLMILPFCKNIKYKFFILLQHWRFVLLVSFLQTFCLYSLFHTGVNIIPASVAAIIVGSGPLFVAVLARLITKEELSGKKLIAIIVGFAGIAIITFARFGGLMKMDFPLFGILILLLANISGSLGNIYVSKSKLQLPPVFFNSVQLTIGGLGILIMSFFVEGVAFSAKPLAYYLSLGWLSFIAAASFSLWFVVLSRPGIKVSEINIWKFIVPVLGAGLSWIILPDENPETFVIIGISFVALSLVVMYYKKR